MSINYRKKYQSEGTKIYERRKSLDSIKLLMRKNPSKAKTELLRHLDENPDDMYAWFYYGKICFDESNLEEAEYAYTKVAFSTAKNKYGGIVGLGDIARIKGDNNLAKKYYRKAIDENPTEQPPTYYILARLETNSGNFDEAINILRRLPENNMLKIEMIRIYAASNEPLKAQEISNTIIPENQYEARSLAFEKAKLAIATDKLIEAKYYLQEAKDYGIKDDEYNKILSEEARLAVELGEYQLAIDNCEELLAENQTAHGFNYLTLGLAKQGLGHYKSAIDCYKLGKKEPAVSYLPKAFCSYQLGCLEIILGEYEQAEKDLKDCIIPQMPPRLSCIELLINIYIKQKTPEKAQDLLKEIKTKYKTSYDQEQLLLCEQLVDKALGKIPKGLNRHSYRDRQFESYSKSLAIEHIKKNHQISDPTAGNFAPSINIAELVEELEPELIPDNLSIIDGMDRYIVDYKDAGITKDGQLADTIYIITFPGTKEILTMYPETSGKAIRKCDIMKTMADRSVKVNRIDSFNKKFANFTPPKK